MLRIRTLGASAGLLALTAGIAAAADFPNYGPPPPTAPIYNPAPAFTWSGSYLGLIGGYGWASTNPSTSPNNGWLGGGYAGVNFQTNTGLVLGIEADATATNKTGSNGGQTVTNPWNATFRGRIGFAMDKVMFYGTGGLAAGRITANNGTSESTTKLGWTAGVGAEAALSQHITGRIEVRHTNLGTIGSSTFPVNGPISYKSNDVMAGIGFKF
jgi:outer membrane immunogenic protein